MASLYSDSVSAADHRRAWLGGFVYGLTGIRAQWRPSRAADPADPIAPPATGIDAGVSADDEAFPWHDPALPIVTRMELADGRPLQQRLMAAMAQLDCGSCGYLCETYSAAIARGEEPNLTLCSPGGKETRQLIRQLLKSAGDRPASKPRAPSASTGWSRQHPYCAKLIETRPLNGPGSTKDTRHVALDLRGSGLRYQVGDALGVYPINCPDLAAQIIRQLGADPAVLVQSPLGERKTLGLALLEDCCLRDPSDELLELLGVSDDADGCDVLDVLTRTRPPELAAAEFVQALEPLNPRLYSIASSMKLVGDEAHLCVGKVAYRCNGRLRKGAASTMLTERVRPGEYVRVFVQPNRNGFTVPQNTAAPMIMVGPGTGVAPFLAFLQERAITAAPGKNWLFFGNQHQATDYLYRDQLQDFVHQGILTRMDTAFSRDQPQRIYVQHRMLQQAAEIWRWLQDGAYVFVCGDASSMARDVDHALRNIVADHGGMSDDDAAAYLDSLARDRRYVRDVY